MIETKQKQKYCKDYGRKTLHVSMVKKMDMGCGFIFANLILCVVTLGIWIPIFLLVVGLGTFSNAFSFAKYRCQGCGRVN